ncbi:MAG: hypothetical protein OZX49_00415 [Immundisolibacter sp.]|nr:hypothetical protein [Immundisolibacter sp.]
MMLPPRPWSRIFRPTVRTPRNTPRALMAITRSHSSTPMSSIETVLLATPALLTSTSMRPKRVQAASTTPSQAASSVTSCGQAAASAPLA